MSSRTLRSRSSWQEVGTLVSLLLALGISVGSIESVKWVTPQPSLLGILIFAVFTGWLLGKSRLPAKAAHPGALLAGVAVTLWQASVVFSDSALAPRINLLVSALASWWQALSAAEPAEGTVHFVVFLVFLTWVLGYLSAWFISRKINSWPAVSLGAIALLVNLSNLPEQNFIFFFYYSVAALLLIGMSRLARDRGWFEKQHIAYPNRTAVYSITSLLFLSGLVVSFAWLTPEVRIEPFEKLTGNVFNKNFERAFDNFFASIPAKQPILRSDDKTELLFGDSSFDRGTQLQFAIFSEQPLYLSTRMYDSYSAKGWSSSSAAESTHRQGTLKLESEKLSKMVGVTYTVVPKLKTDILLNGGNFISATIPVSMQTLEQASFSIDLTRRTSDSSLPADVASLALSLRNARSAGGQISPDDVREMLPEGTVLTGFTTSEVNQAGAQQTQPVTSDSPVSSVRVTRTSQTDHDTVVISSLYSLKPDRHYTVTAGISAATPAELSATDGRYPSWVTDFYLQLPPEFPERIRRLSEAITRQAETRYEKTIAIKEYLSRIQYQLDATKPPAGRDGVEYFLFSERTGNCVNFASAMAVMLRSIGIPSRVLIGYVPGEWEPNSGAYILTAKERHAWPEVYSPGYGWVGFEATPGFNTEPGLAGKDEDFLDIQSSSSFEEEMFLEDFGAGSLDISGVTSTTTPNRWGMYFMYTVGSIFSLVLIIWLFGTGRERRPTRPDNVSRIYRQMCFFASLDGLSPQPQQTPLEYGTKLATLFPSKKDAFNSIAQTYAESQYGPNKKLGRWEGYRLQQSWREARQRLIKQRFGLR